jgi:kinesin family protein 2/24
MPALANGASKTNAQTAEPHQPGRIRQWLNKAGLVKYFDGFNKMTESQFASLMMQDYPKHGVSDMADKQKLFRLLKTVNAQENIALDPTANIAVEHKTPVKAMKTANADDFAPLLVSPADEDLLSEAVGLAGDVLATPGGLLELHGGAHDADDDLLRDVDIRGASGEASGDAPDPNDPKTKPFVPSPSLSNKSKSSPVDRLSELSRFTGAAVAASGGDTAVAAAAKAAAEQPRIRVVVRKRPLNKKELAKEEEDIVTMERDVSEPSGGEAGESQSRSQLSAGQLTLWEPRQKVDLTQYTEKHEFAFDDVYPTEVSNDEIYTSTVHPLIGTIFDRCKVTCFAYGQTGSGKTYTMSPLPTRAAGEILCELAQPRNEGLALWVSFFEIYGGKVYDLLNGRKKLVIREDARQQMCVVGLQEFEVDNVTLVERLIEHGTAARCTGSTGANSESSRSHAILQLSLKQRDGVDPNAAKMPPSVARQLKAKEGANHTAIHGKFSFIDLAGSERGADTDQNDRQTRLEGAEINKSLLALKECIRALDMGSNHVPFRGSKLTEVLRDSFLGDSRTVMIANISPATGSCEHTLNTLRYAYRVKELRSEGQGGPKKNASGGNGSKLGPDGVTPIARGASMNFNADLQRLDLNGGPDYSSTEPEVPRGRAPTPAERGARVAPTNLLPHPRRVRTNRDARRAEGGEADGPADPGVRPEGARQKPSRRGGGAIRRKRTKAVSRAGTSDARRGGEGCQGGREDGAHGWRGCRRRRRGGASKERELWIGRRRSAEVGEYDAEEAAAGNGAAVARDAEEEGTAFFAGARAGSHQGAARREPSRGVGVRGRRRQGDRRGVRPGSAG